MNKKGLIIVIFAVIFVASALTYIDISNNYGMLSNLINKNDSAYVAPKLFTSLFQKLKEKPYYNSDMVKQTDKVINEKSDAFIKAAFNYDTSTIEQLLDTNTSYIKSEDGSSFIRYVGNDIHVEGYMATDKKLIKAKKRWHVVEDDGTVTYSMEVYLENTKSPQLWYLHFIRVKNDWKIFMLENDI